jgi:hypothetical protein
MKKIRFSVLVLCCAFFACDDDDNNSNGSNLDNDLTGTYELTRIAVPTAQDYDNDGDTDTNLVKEGECYNTSWISFKSDGTYQQFHSWTSVAENGATLDCNTQLSSGTYVQTGNTVVTTQTSGDMDLSTSYTFNASAHTLTATQAGGSYAGWNSVASIFAYLTGDLQLEFKKYTDNENDNGAGQDDDSNVNSNALSNVTGEYDLSSYLVGEAQDLNNDGESSTNLVSETTCYGQSTIDLNSDGTYEQTWSYASITNLGTQLSCETETTTGWWTRQGDSIILNRLSGGNVVGSSFSVGSNSLTQTNANWSYPTFNSALALFTSANGTVNLTYSRQD